MPGRKTFVPFLFPQRFPFRNSLPSCQPRLFIFCVLQHFLHPSTHPPLRPPNRLFSFPVKIFPTINCSMCNPFTGVPPRTIFSDVFVFLCCLPPLCPALPAPPPPFQSFKYVGTEITWVGEGVEEYGHVKDEPDNILVRVDPRYFRPTEVELLLVSTSSHALALS